MNFNKPLKCPMIKKLELEKNFEHSSSQGELDTRWPAQAGWLNRPEGWYATWCPIRLAMNGGCMPNKQRLG